jgi:outer membrane receptor protein involved in Fe transport
MLITALAQAAAAASAPGVATPPPQPEGVISYPAAFFTGFNSTNALDMVNRIPGFTLDTGASVRGFEGAAGNVLIDGQRPSSKSDAIDQILARIPLNQVDHIEVIRGGAPGVDMQGKTVLANIVRKKNGGLRGLIALADNIVLDTSRHNPQIRLEGGGGSDGRNWEASVRYAVGVDDGGGPGAEVRYDGAGRPISLNSISAHAGGPQVTAATSYETPLLGGQGRVNARFFHNDFKSYETDSFVFPAGQSNLDRFKDKEDDTEVGGRYSRAFGARVNLEAVALRTTKDETITDDFRQVPGPRDLFILDRYSTETIGRAVVKFRQTDRLSWELGGEGALNKLDSETSFLEDAAPVPLPAANVTVKERRWEVFGKATWRVLDTLTVEAGVRQEGSHISSRGDVTLAKDLYFTKPRLAVSWSPTASDQVRLRVEREVGQLNFNDFVATSSLTTSTVTAGNPDLNPEQAWVGEAAWEHRFWKSGSVVLTYRHYELKDAIDRAPIFNRDGSFADAPANIGDGTKDEYVVELTTPLDKLGLKGAQLKGVLTKRVTDVIDPTTHRPREISKVRPLEWEAHFTQPLPWANMNWGVDVCCGRRETFYRVDVVDDQKVQPFVDVFWEWKPRPDFQIHIEADNLLARGFHDYRTVYGGPRSTSAVTVVDARPQDFSREVFIRLRKYFG